MLICFRVVLIVGCWLCDRLRKVGWCWYMVVMKLLMVSGRLWLNFSVCGM